MRKVWVNGCFDILHIGHIKLLEYANNLGTVKVGLDSDERIKEKKGDNRPFNILKNRIEFISSIKYVQSVTSFDSDEMLINEIKKYKPNIIVVGEEYKDKKIIGSEYVENVIFFKKLSNYSTTNIINYKNNNY